MLERLAKHNIFDYNYQTVVNGLGDNSPAKTFLDAFVGLPKFGGIHWLNSLQRALQIENAVNVEDLVVEYQQKLADFSKRYPLLDKLGSYADEGDVCEYINLIDAHKGV